MFRMLALPFIDSFVMLGKLFNLSMLEFSPL